MIKFHPMQATVTQQSEEGDDATVEIQPLARGWGDTLGTAYRRVLVSSVSGTAVTYVDFVDVTHGGKPVPVLHEYQPLPGVRETVLEISHNLRAATFRLGDDDSVAVVELMAGDAGVVTAGMISPQPGVEILDPDAVICHLEGDASVHLRIGLRRDRGFIPSTELRPVDVNPDWSSLKTFPSGVVTLDADHSPVLSVFPEASPHRVGESGDFQKLALRIQVRPGYRAEDVFREATEILFEHFRRLREEDWSLDFSLSAPAEEDQPVQRFRPISELGLQTRTENAMRNNNITTIEQLTSLREQELRSLKRVGEVAQREIIDRMEALGLSFRED